MKKILSIIGTLFLLYQTHAQIVTDNPYVEHGYISSGGFETNLIRIALDDEFTIVFLECIVPRRCNECWVSLSSMTRISDNKGKNSLKIESWGVYDNGEPSELNFNERYSIKNDRRYLLYMLFPRLKGGIEKINIVEKNHAGSEGWAWRGVHINNPIESSQSKIPSQKKTGTSPGSSYTENDDFIIAGTGTCFALSSKGHLATCFHVVEDAQRIRIRGINGDFSKTYNARVIITDKTNDLAIIKIDDPSFSNIEPLPYVVENRTTDVGEDVFALGYPLKAFMGDEIKLTNGIVSSRTGFQGDATSYQLSVAVYPGNSGGPLFNNQGDIIGIVNARLLESATYAIKTPYLHTLAQSADDVHISGTNQISTLSLPEKVKQLRKFVYIIEIEN